MNRNLHNKPFDETTLTKLRIFEEYAKEWLPVFIMSGQQQICIFDFFAGTGYDKNGEAGSPIRILEQVGNFVQHLSDKQSKVHLYFNEWDKAKFDLLKRACENYLIEYPEVGAVVVLHYSNEDFDACFDRLLPEINRFPSLVFLDQNGIKFLSDKYLSALEKMQRTDFLYFVSSSHFSRFGNTDEFKRYFSFDIEEVKKQPYQFIHRSLLKQLKSTLPANTKLKLYPFSLKKGANIHGLIFGAKNPLAVFKFLTVAWKANPINGDANFDIDGDIMKMQPDLFGHKPLTKIESFEQELEAFLQEKGTVTNREVFLFALEKGHLPKHANDHIRSLKGKSGSKGKVEYEGASPKVGYDAWKDPKNEVKIYWKK